jgi:hypothetical protein
VVPPRFREANMYCYLEQELKIMVDKKIELMFVDKEGSFYPIDEVDSVELAKGFKKISQEIATRLRLQKEQR